MRMKLGTLKRIIREAVEDVMADPAMASAPAGYETFESPWLFLNGGDFAKAVRETTALVNGSFDFSTVEPPVGFNEAKTKDFNRNQKDAMAGGSYARAAGRAVIADLNGVHNTEIRAIEADIAKGLTPENARATLEAVRALQSQRSAARAPMSFGGPGDPTAMAHNYSTGKYVPGGAGITGD